MEEKRKSKKKPYRSVLSNLRWFGARQRECAPGVPFLYALLTPVNVFLSYAAIYLPSLVVAEVTENQTPAHAAASVGLLLLAVLLGELLQKPLDYLIKGRQGFYRARMAERLTRKALDCFYQQYERKEMRDLFDRAHRATEQWDGALPLLDLPQRAWGILESVLGYCLFGAVISFVSPWLIVLLTLAPAINLLCARAYQNWCYRNREKWADADSRLHYVNRKPGDFDMAKDIRIYGMAGWLRELYRDLTAERAAFDKQQTRRHFLSRLADLSVILLRDGAAYVLLLRMALQGEVTADKFILYFAAISSFADWVGKLLTGVSGLRHTSLLLCDLREYLEYPERDGSGEAKTDDLAWPPEIVFDHVSFRYDGATEDALHDVSFTMRPGEKIALVGLNGAGKTTLAKLLCGLYRPTAGEIRVGGESVARFLRRDYYRLFSPVFQDVRTAFFSLAETVSCKPESETDFARVERCMRATGLGEKIDALPQGIRTRLDKQVNRDGTELSGGETQKLLLARALYKDAPVLVLDEPTAALDPIAENAVYRRYDEMAAHKSALFISHRLASTRFCDRILYLARGRIVEEGTHEELLAANGAYGRLYEMQSCWYREDRKGKEAAGE